MLGTLGARTSALMRSIDYHVYMVDTGMYISLLQTRVKMKTNSWNSGECNNAPCSALCCALYRDERTKGQTNHPWWGEIESHKPKEELGSRGRLVSVYYLIFILTISVCSGRAAITLIGRGRNSHRYKVIYNDIVVNNFTIMTTRIRTIGAASTRWGICLLLKPITDWSARCSRERNTYSIYNRT